MIDLDKLDKPIKDNLPVVHLKNGSTITLVGKINEEELARALDISRKIDELMLEYCKNLK